MGMLGGGGGGELMGMTPQLMRLANFGGGRHGRRHGGGSVSIIPTKRSVCARSQRVKRMPPMTVSATKQSISGTA